MSNFILVYMFKNDKCNTSNVFIFTMSDSILVFVDVDILTLKSDLKPVFGIGKMVDSYNSLQPSRYMALY